MSKTTKRTTQKNPADMLRQGAPRLIRNDVELREYTDALFALTAKTNPTAAELDAIDLLTLLVQTYESQGRTVPRYRATEARVG